MKLHLHNFTDEGNDNVATVNIDSCGHYDDDHGTPRTVVGIGGIDFLIAERHLHWHEDGDLHITYAPEYARP